MEIGINLYAGLPYREVIAAFEKMELRTLLLWQTIPILMMRWIVFGDAAQRAKKLADMVKAIANGSDK